MRTVLFILDSLNYRSALLTDKLLDLLPEDKRFVCKSLAHAPYTPSSITTMLTGKLPAEHQYWTFPVSGEPTIPAREYLFAQAPVPARWASTNPLASYMFPRFFDTSDPAGLLRENSDSIIVLHVWETHIPYARDMDIQPVLDEMDKLPTLEDRILYSHSGLDAAIEKMMPILDVLDLDKDRVIFTSDHGEAFGQPHPISGIKRWLHQRCTYEELVCPVITNFDTGYKQMSHNLIANIILNGYFKNEKFQLPNWTATSRWFYDKFSTGNFIENAVFDLHLNHYHLMQYPMDSIGSYNSVSVIHDENTGQDIVDNKVLEYEDLIALDSLSSAGIFDHDALGAVIPQSDDLDDDIRERLERLGYL